MVNATVAPPPHIHPASHTQPRCLMTESECQRRIATSEMVAVNWQADVIGVVTQAPPRVAYTMWPVTIESITHTGVRIKNVDTKLTNSVRAFLMYRQNASAF
jgi:hypothetical protein